MKRQDYNAILHLPARNLSVSCYLFVSCYYMYNWESHI